MAGSEPASDPLIGRSLSHFRIEAKLGEGGMGVVYRATDERLRREVALKVLPDGLASDPERRRRFLREARAAAAVSHRNIATVLDIGEAEGHVFIAMELVQGETLRARMEPGLTHTEALRIAREIAKGLARAHESGVVHRDLKPENVMVTRDGEVKILDFGLAKLVDVDQAATGARAEDALGRSASDRTLTAEGRVMGTPPYMSPEQAEGRAEIDAGSDVFSFGTMLYEMLSGVRPFDGDTSIAVLYAVLHREPEPLEAACPGAPAAAVAVVARCLRKARKERFASGRELSAALESEDGARAIDTPSGKALPAARVSTVSGMGTALGATLAADAAPVDASAVQRTGGSKPRRGPRTWVATGAFLLASALVVAWSRLHPPTSTTATPTPSASAAPQPALPCNAEATRLFDEASETFDQRSEDLATDVFTRAAQADGGCAPAYLRLALVDLEYEVLPSSGRTHFAEAHAHQDHLGEVDRALLDAIAPYFAAKPDDDAVLENLRALASRFPDDALVAFEHGRVAARRHKASDARAAFEQAIALRPRLGGAYASLATLATSPAEREQRLAQCRQAAPRHIYCDAVEQDVLMSGSNCAAFERFAREAVARNPGLGSQRMLLAALAANDASRSELDEALRQVVTVTPKGDVAKSIDSETRLSIAILEGDYGTAEQILRALPAATSADLSERGRWAEQLATLLEDTGRTAEADDIVRQVVRSARALVPPANPADMARFDGRAIAAGALRRTDVDATFGPAPTTTDPDATWEAWQQRQLYLVNTPDEARKALSTMPDRPPSARDGGTGYRLGRLRALAGDFAGARREVESAIEGCDVMDKASDARAAFERTIALPSVLERPRAFFLLGEACDRTGDVAAARAAYETVVKKWGGLKPKAVLADRARARLASLPTR